MTIEKVAEGLPTNRGYKRAPGHLSSLSMAYTNILVTMNSLKWLSLTHTQRTTNIF